MIGFILDALIEKLPIYFDGWNLRESINYGLEFGALPPPTASDWYLAFDFAGESQTARPEDYFLREEYSITFGIWKRQTEIPRDRLGRLSLTQDLYRPQALTLHATNRKLVTTFHQKFWLPNYISEKINASESNGNVAISPLIYLGCGANEQYTVDSMRSNDVETFIGRRCKFKGLMRIQKIEEMG